MLEPEPKGIKHRKRWSWEEKEKIVAESAREGANVAEVARKYGIASNLLYRWRNVMGVVGGEVPSLPAYLSKDRKSMPVSRVARQSREDIAPDHPEDVESLHSRVACLEDQVKRQSRQLQTLMSSIVTAQIGCP